MSGVQIRWKMEVKTHLWQTNSPSTASTFPKWGWRRRLCCSDFMLAVICVILNLLFCWFPVFGEETGLRHAVVWLLADHRGCDPAPRGSRVWKVKPVFPFSSSKRGWLNAQTAFSRQVWGSFRGTCSSRRGVRCHRGFLPAARCRQPSRHVVHSQTAHALHARHSWWAPEHCECKVWVFPLFPGQKQTLFIPCSFSDGHHRSDGNRKEGGRFVQTGSVFWDWNDCWFHSGGQSQHSLRVSTTVRIFLSSSSSTFCSVLIIITIFSRIFLLHIWQGENYRLHRCCRQLHQSPARLEVYP